MVYANIRFDGNREGSFNIGDDLQILAIENLYRYMGIDYDKVIRIGLSELSTYDGEYAILPISFPLYGYREGTYITMFSPKIIPVFLGLSVMSENILPEECDYLRRFEPIGCRDYHTVKILRSKNVFAYLGGCMTVTLPRKLCGGVKKAYLVDIPSSYRDYIPSDILDGAEIRTQVMERCDDPEDAIRNRLEEYAQNASMVVTTRLHCALPCIAMGVPVVCMKAHYSFRFPTLSRYIHVWTEEEFDKIDWFPNSIEYEDKKRQILDMARHRISEAYEKYRDILDLSSYYEEGVTERNYYIEHFDNVVESAASFFESHPSAKYAVWGITQKADMICSYLEKEYPGSQLVHVQDRSKKIRFHGIESDDNVDLLKKADYIFVTAATANDAAIFFFENNGITNYCVSTDGIGQN